MSELAVLLGEKSFCPVLVEKVKDYFKDPEHRKKFEDWYRKKYGKDYEWR